MGIRHQGIPAPDPMPTLAKPHTPDAARGSKCDSHLWAEGYISAVAGESGLRARASSFVDKRGSCRSKVR